MLAMAMIDEDLNTRRVPRTTARITGAQAAIRELTLTRSPLTSRSRA